MISPFLSKLYGIILENKISEWLEIQGKRGKCQVGFRRNHSTMDHLFILGIIREECCNNKTSLLEPGCNHHQLGRGLCDVSRSALSSGTKTQQHHRNRGLKKHNSTLRQRDWPKELQDEKNH